MYPFLRMAVHMARARRAAPLRFGDTHVSDHRIWPIDLDPWRELNNGRTLTLYDLGRTGMSIRLGLPPILKRNGWGLTVAGSTVRYRKRVVLGDRIAMHTRVIGWERRFMYVEQSMWRGDDCTGHMLLRLALISSRRLHPPAQLLRELGQPDTSPPLPDWAAAWADADALRPWPPSR